MIQQLLAGFNAAAGGGSTPGSGVITWQSAGALSYNGNPAYPASIANGDLLILLVGQKYETASVSTPSGWTLLGTKVGTGFANGTTDADSGNQVVTAFYKVADGSETGSLALTLNTNNVSGSTIHRLSKDTGTWDVEAAFGEYVFAGTNMVINFATDPDVVSGDYVIVFQTVATDQASYSSPAITQTGVTFGSLTTVATIATSSGADLGGQVVRAASSSGASAGNPVFSATAASSFAQVCVGAFIRIRAV